MIRDLSDFAEYVPYAATWSTKNITQFLCKIIIGKIVRIGECDGSNVGKCLKVILIALKVVLQPLVAYFDAL